MLHSVHILIGPARSGKTERLLARYRQTLRSGLHDGSFGQTLWLSPTSRAAMAVRDVILTDDLTACLEPGIATFERLADQVLAQLADPPRPLSTTMRRELLRRVVESALAAGELSFLRETAYRDSFLDLLGDHISELQRRGITPPAFAKSKAPGENPTQHAELSRLYADYEHRLASARLCDFESRHQAVRDALAADAALLGELRLIVVDGFTDFTHVQQDILAQLAARADSLFISLPGDPIPENSGRECDTEAASPARPDLFAKTAATLAEFRSRHKNLQIEYVAPRPSSWPALDHIASLVFCNPRDVPQPPPEVLASLNRAEIIAAAGPHDEIVQIARAIKQELLAGQAQPSDFVVAFRHLDIAAARIREVLTEFGIPHALESGKPLVATGLVSTLLALLRLGAEDWPFRRLLTVITNNLLTALDSTARASTEWLIRELQIASGRESLVGRITQLASEADEQTESTSPHHIHRVRAAVTALPLVGALASALDELPQSASPTEWFAALLQLGTRLGIPSFKPQSENPEPHLLENHFAQEHLEKHFASLDRLAAALGETSSLARDEFLRRFLSIASQESLPRPSDDVGRVRVLNAATARHVAVKHLFLAGMSEQAFPTPERAGRLYTEADYRFFSNVAEQGRTEAIPAVTRASEEMLLFYEVLTRATDRLTISYPALDDKAIALPPSPYVAELNRALKSETIHQHTTPRPSPLPPDKAPMSPVDWRIAAVHQAQQKNPSFLKEFLNASPSTARALDAALRAVAARAKRDDFGPAEGLLISDAARRRLAERFGPSHLWSPSQWQRYAHCPFQFFMQDVLGLEALTEIALETDFRRRGTLWHRVLATFHRNLRETHGPNHVPSRGDRAVFRAALQQVLTETVAAVPRTGLDSALAELDRRHIDKWVDHYFEHHDDYDSAWTALEVPLAPTHFEFRFGALRSEETDYEDPHSVATPLEIDLDGEKVRVTGRIDRIDVGRLAGESVFSVIDYKSGRRPTLNAEQIAGGEHLQPVLYVMAAQALLFAKDQAEPVWAGYWGMAKGTTRNSRYSLKCHVDIDEAKANWADLQATAKQQIKQSVTDIRQGNFPVFSRDDDCTTNCPYSTTCRITQIRTLGKQWVPEETPP